MIREKGKEGWESLLLGPVWMMGKKRRREGGREGAWLEGRMIKVEIDETDVGHDQMIYAERIGQESGRKDDDR